MKVNATVNVNHNMTVEELKKILATIPDDSATISIHTYAGDRPGESDYSTITFNWEV